MMESMKLFSAIGCLALGTLYHGTISATQGEESFKTLAKVIEKMRLDIDSLDTKVKNGEKGQDMQEMKMKMIYIEKENQEMKEEIKMLKTDMEFMGSQGLGNNSGTDVIEMKLEDGQEKITAA